MLECVRINMVLFRFFLIFLLSVGAEALTSEEIFQFNQTRLFQIKIVDKESDSKSAIGSGFLIGDEFTVATNYHVVSSMVDEPGKYRIVFVRDDGSEGDLDLFDFDIVSDLALLKSDEPLGEAMAIADQEPNKGAVIYALGNPLDLGMTVVPGTYNGLADHAYYQRIHFSGSVNSGMSGGPVLNSSGDVVGINVATAGNQVSFLVPVSKLKALLDSQPSVDEQQSFVARAEQQLIVSQENLIGRIFENEWPVDSLGETQVLGEIPNLVSCWGRSSRDDESDDAAVVEVSKGCSLQDSIFINRRMTTGSIEYEFYWLEAKGVDDRKFFKHLEKNMGGFPGNRATEDFVSEFKCNERFTNVSAGASDKPVAKSFYCARRYKEFPSLFDVLYLRLAKRGERAFISHFTLAGVTQESASRFSSAFVEHVQWR